MEKISDQELLDLIDNKLGLERSRKLQEQINGDKGLKSRFNILKSVHAQLEKTSLEVPSARFAEKVMSNLHNPQYVADLANGFSKRNLFTFFTIFAGILVGVYILTTGIVTVPFFDQFTITPLNLQGNQIDVNPLFDGLTSGTIFKTFLIVDMILGWFFLDKLVLKPYFEARRKRMAY